jgi:hypothetical protein
MYFMVIFSISYFFLNNTQIFKNSAQKLILLWEMQNTTYLQMMHFIKFDTIYNNDFLVCYMPWATCTQSVSCVTVTEAEKHAKMQW